MRLVQVRENGEEDVIIENATKPACRDRRQDIIIAYGWELPPGVTNMRIEEDE